jgi:signal transduction histidine kinase
LCRAHAFAPTLMAMNSLGDLNYKHFGLSDGNTPPFSSSQSKLHSILNVLRGHEEFTLNLDGTIISSNLEAVNITSYEEWEVIGKDLSIFYSPEDIANGQPQADLESSVQNGKFTVDSWKLKKRQIRFWARMKIIALYDSLENLRGYKLILRDASHKVFSDFHVQKVKNEYLNLYHNSIFGIIRLGKQDGVIKLANKKALEILGRTDFQDLLFEDAFETREDQIRFSELLEQHRYLNNFEFQLKSPPDRKRWASIDCKYYISTGCIEGIIIDVTDKKYQELALQKLSNDLNTFIYHASHDLRSPLTSIMGLLNLMDMSSQAEKVPEYTMMIRERIKHMDLLLKDLSTIAFNNHSEINYEPVFVKAEISFMLRTVFSETKVQFIIDMDDEIIFVSDVLRFRTMMKNLISNSIKFHNQIEKNPFVKVTGVLNQNGLEIIVADNGIGIEQAEVDKLCNMFHRGHSSRSGSGLGLYTVRSMADQLNGHVRIESAIGVGTTVTMVLPNRVNNL